MNPATDFRLLQVFFSLSMPYFRLSKIASHCPFFVLFFLEKVYNNAPCPFILRGPQSAAGFFQQTCLHFPDRRRVLTISSYFDFRGCGFVSLENLLFFARTYPVGFFFYNLI